MSPLFKKDSDTKNGPESNEDWLLPEDSRKHLTKLFKKLDQPVRFQVFTRKGDNETYNDYMIRFIRDVARTSDKIEAEFLDLDGDVAKEHGVTLSPTLLVNPDDYNIRFVGPPLGEEGRAFVETVLRVSARKSGVTPTTAKILEELADKRHVRVFSSPSCPYCPGQVLHAVKSAIERPDFVSMEAIDASEFPELANEYDVGPVPHTVFNEEHTLLGLAPEERFALELFTLESVEPFEEEEHDHADHDHEHAEAVDLVVIGAGPAGLTAGIYGERSGMRTVILEKAVIGGQVALTPVVENYPGFANVGGKQLVDTMADHAREYADIREGEGVSEIKIGRKLEVFTNRAHYIARALIFATGATWRKLGVPGEDAFFGRGVHYCASCDGYMYKDRQAVIVGGGNTALTDALHLKNLGVKVTIVHRRDAFRAEQHLQDSVAREELPVFWNTEVLEILGDDGKVMAVKLKDNKAGTEREHLVDAVFVAIGQDPNSQMAGELGVTLTKERFIQVDRGMRTNIPRIYAAGDVTGGVQQIVTAVGEGTTAALSAFEDLADPYWKAS